MYIAIITGGIPEKENPGNGIFQLDQAKALKSCGAKVVLLSLNLFSIKHNKKYGLHKLELDGIPVYQFHMPVGMASLFSFYHAGQFALGQAYTTLLEEQGAPDIIHSHFYHISYIAVPFFKTKNIPVIVTEHAGNILQNPWETKVKKICDCVYQNSALVITVSNCLKEAIQMRYPQIQIEVISNVFNQGNIKIEFKRLEQTDKVNVISVGNLEEGKRAGLLIEAFAEAFKADKRIHLYIYGNGSQRRVLEEIIMQNGLGETVHLMGFVKREKILEFMRECAFFVLPSEHETFGVAYIEAMLMGLPVIATRCGGPQEFVDQTNGVLIDVDDKVGLIEALVEMRMNYASYDSTAISKNIVERFSPKVIGRQLLKQYDKVNKKKRGDYESFQ